MAVQLSAQLSAARAGARDPAGSSSARLPARPPDHLCGLGYAPSDPRQSDAETTVLVHAERLLNMVHAYCAIRDSWTGWLRGDAMSRTLYERIVPEMRALRDAERRIIDKPSVTLLAVLDYAARARAAVPAYTPRETTDYPQSALSNAVREVCERMIADAERAALVARQASARAYAARMTQAIERERAEEARRQQAMADASVSETPEEVARATAALEARIAVYERERQRVLAEAGAGSGAEAADEEAAATDSPVSEAGSTVTPKPRGIEVVWHVVSRRWRAVRLEPTPETAPAFARRLVLIDRGARGGMLRAFGEPALDSLRETINGVTIRFAHRPAPAKHLRRDRYEAPLTPTQVRKMREARA